MFLAPHAELIGLISTGPAAGLYVVRIVVEVLLQLGKVLLVGHVVAVGRKVVGPNELWVVLPTGACVAAV